MIRERGLFTLMGSKPMTEFDIDIGIGESLNERQLDFMSLLASMENPNEAASFDEFIAHFEKTPPLCVQRQLGLLVSDNYLCR